MSTTKKLFCTATVLGAILILAATAFAMKEEYNYMSAASLNKAVNDGANVAIVDIQDADAFKDHHIKGAIETCAYPVKSGEDKAKFTATLAELKGSTQNIVVICPRGKGGAERTVDYFIEQGIAPYRLFILTDGQDGWPYAIEK